MCSDDTVEPLLNGPGNHEMILMPLRPRTRPPISSKVIILLLNVQGQSIETIGDAGKALTTIAPSMAKFVPTSTTEEEQEQAQEQRVN